MKNIKFLNAKEAREIAKLINDQWDAGFAFEDFVLRSRKDKLYIVSRDLDLIDFKHYNIEQFGLYVAHINERNEVRLSIEGSQLIGPNAKKNVIEISPNLAKLWMAGQDIPFKTDCSGTVIVRSGDDHLGCGKVVTKEVSVSDAEGNEKKEMQQTILNFVPKTRRHVKD
jgi:NOL1/NOP2/fmu family ribosome biogenesis protein